MGAPPFLMSLFTTRVCCCRRCTGAIDAGPARRRRACTTGPGRILVGVTAALVLAGVFGGVASASNGDPNGSKTGTDVTNLVPVEKQSTQTDPTPEDVAAQTEKNRVAINITWLMVGGVLVLFMQAGFALVETGFTRAKNAAHTMMMNMVIFALGVVGWFSLRLRVDVRRGRPTRVARAHRARVTDAHR